MSLSAALQQFGTRQRLAQANPLPAVAALEQVSVEMAARFDAGGEPPPREALQSILLRVRLALQNDEEDSLSRRDWAKSIWGIWDTKNPLGQVPRYWPALKQFLATQRRRTYYKSLVLTYLRDFDPADPTVIRVAALLREFVGGAEQADWLWAKRQNELHLFQPTLAPKHIATQALASGKPLAASLSSAGLTGSASRGGMERAAFADALATLRTRISLETDPGLLNRVLEWGEHGADLRFPSTRKAIAETLLMPWRQAQPPADAHALIMAFLLKHYQDPRIEPSGWIGVDGAAQQVMRRWLTKVSLEQFIRVVTKVADPGHWRYRRAFWMAYYQKNLIDEAWVLFGRTARLIAGKGLDDEGGHGSLTGGLADHCVLLMRIGDLVIADWSHNGSCRIWTAQNRFAPDFYRRHAHSQIELQRGANLEQRHDGSDRQRWQSIVAEYIRDSTGRWVPSSDRIP